MAARNGKDEALQQRLQEATDAAQQPGEREDIADIVHEVMSSLQGDLSATDLRLYNELKSLADYIERARSDIATIKPDEIRSEHIPTATDELDAVIGATEDATAKILECCEQIENIAGNVEESTGEQLTDVVTQIYEACSFQDITGQRIAKVVNALKNIEEKVDVLVKAFGDEVGAQGEQESGQGESQSDDSLMEGPQMPGQGVDQDEIDRLLNSFD